MDKGATQNICANNAMFSSYNPMNNEKLFKGNISSSKVEEQAKVVLKMTSCKELILNKVFHVPNILKDLVSSSLLSKNDFKLVFVSDKFIFIKSNMNVDCN